MGLRADYVEGVGKLWYCATHQTLQAKPVCPKCRKQDGTGVNGWYTEIKETTDYKNQTVAYDIRMSAWRAKAKEINGRIIDKYS